MHVIMHESHLFTPLAQKYFSKSARIIITIFSDNSDEVGEAEKLKNEAEVGEAYLPWTCPSFVFWLCHFSVL